MTRFQFLIFAASIVFMPLLRHQPEWPIMAAMLTVIFLIPIIVTSKNRLGAILTLMGFVLVFVASMISGRLMNYDLEIDYERTILGSAAYQDQIRRFSTEALYLPYRVRPLIFNGSAYFYSALGHALKFLNFSNLFSSLLIVNFVQIIVGAIRLYRLKRWAFNRLTMIFLAAFVAVGLAIQPDTFAHLYLLLPVFMYLSWVGARFLSPRISLMLLLISLIWIWIP